MFYKLKKKFGSQQVAKYYGTDQNLAAQRQTKGWDLMEDSKDPEQVISRSFNSGALKEGRFKITIDDSIEIMCPTEGAANQFIEKFGTIYKDIIVERLDSKENKAPSVIPSDDGI